ncbi:hypothetical protein PR048_007582 [Dryococelus australis]|uniref:Uncharacterized protein n=1 Tax=Dryococelus australis TaxID=614101 RepID=A0ABQ9HUW7_9NEOP|nr:hypothetical protein PR048_007582 [Dryococelus australis]
MELHNRQADSFYREKRLARKQSRKVKEFEAIIMDYGKNLPIPNISTGEFNVHVLSDGSSTFYTYDKTIVKKGSDEGASMLYNFFFEVLSSDVREIHIFCDLCGGQNKNWTVISGLTRFKLPTQLEATHTWIRRHLWKLQETDERHSLVPESRLARFKLLSTKLTCSKLEEKL